MNSILKNPITNAVCLSLFSAFYMAVFIQSSWHGGPGLEQLLYYNRGQVYFWSDWSRFLEQGYHVYIGYGLMALTVLIAVMLVSRRRPYDEYHVSILIQCLASATVLTLLAIAVFYIRVLNNPVGIVEKFTLFICIHWVSVVLSDLVYVFICRWR